MRRKKKKEHIPLSASRIKTLQGCSWKYFCSYLLKLPDAGNLGSQLGSIAHTIFELLGDPRHLKHYKKALKTKNIYKVECLRRLVKKHFAIYGIKDKEEAYKLNDMVIAGLEYDFFGKDFGKPTESHSELAFDMTVSEGDKDYRIKGFIDKLFLYKKKCTALIRDFKTSKKVFDGKDVEDNLQDQMYSLAVSKLYPEFLKRKVEFPFLQLMPKMGKDALIKMEPLSDSDLEAFEYILTEIQKYIDNFSEKDALKNMAYDKPFPTDKSFSGRLLCGFDEFDGHMKKDGTPRWGCSCKWASKFYVVRNKKGEIMRSYFLDDDDKIEYDASKGEKLYLEEYKGCPRWNKKSYICK